jgi:uncharacterized membrane protein YgcG
MKKAALVILITAALIACKSGPTGYITDNANVFDEATRNQLETTFAALKARKKIDFAIVTVKTTGDKSVFDYSLNLARERKQNSSEANVGGLLLLVAVDDRTWRIQISSNLEPHLTNELLTNMSTPMTDSFKQKQYTEGIRKYVNAIIEKLDQLDIH